MKTVDCDKMSNPQTKKADGGDQPKKMPEKPSLKSSNATGPATASKARWGKAITGVRTVGTFKVSLSI